MTPTRQYSTCTRQSEYFFAPKLGHSFGHHIFIISSERPWWRLLRAKMRTITKQDQIQNNIGRQRLLYIYNYWRVEKKVLGLAPSTSSEKIQLTSININGPPIFNQIIDPSVAMQLRTKVTKLVFFSSISRKAEPLLLFFVFKNGQTNNWCLGSEIFFIFSILLPSNKSRKGNMTHFIRVNTQRTRALKILFGVSINRDVSVPLIPRGWHCWGK